MLPAKVWRPDRGPRLQRGLFGWIQVGLENDHTVGLSCFEFVCIALGIGGGPLQPSHLQSCCEVIRVQFCPFVANRLKPFELLLKELRCACSVTTATGKPRDISKNSRNAQPTTAFHHI